MGWLSRWSARRAARAYVRDLPHELRRSWGGSDVYTVDQVISAVQKLGLKGRYIALAYAAFLTQPDYGRIAADLPLVLPYDIARRIFREALPDGDDFSDTRDAETKSARMITRESI
ncbi:MAG: DUF6559 family protein [Phenylobacterium sp.]